MSTRSASRPTFETTVTLLDAYRIMEAFASGYLARGDAPISDFLHAYAGQVAPGETTDPAAADDFLAVAERILARGAVR